MTLPVKTLRFGPYDFTVEALPEGSGNMGEFDYDAHALRLRNRWANKRQAATTALHECTHGWFWIADIKPDTPEEEAVTRLEMAASSFIRDNQAFMRWLVKALA